MDPTFAWFEIGFRAGAFWQSWLAKATFSRNGGAEMPLIYRCFALSVRRKPIRPGASQGEPKNKKR
jgi:hypothetical protein